MMRKASTRETKTKRERPKKDPSPESENLMLPLSPKRPCLHQKQTAEGLHMQIDMPGLSKDDVTLTVVENKLVVKGEGKNTFRDYDWICDSYSAEFDLPPKKDYKKKAIKAEMKNGVLKAFVPKIKDEERTTVFNVRIECIE